MTGLSLKTGLSSEKKFTKFVSRNVLDEVEHNNDVDGARKCLLRGA